MAALVIGSRLAEITTAEQARACVHTLSFVPEARTAALCAYTHAHTHAASPALTLRGALLYNAQEVFANKPPASWLVGDARYAAVDEYWSNHTRGACATVQLIASAALPPAVVASLGWDMLSASMAAANDAAATAALLSAFNWTSADLLALTAGLRTGGSLGSGDLIASAITALGVDAPALNAAILTVVAAPLNASAWTLLADAAVAALLSPSPSNSNTSSSVAANASASLSLASIASYNGPLPVPSFDEYVAVHLLIRGLFSRYEVAWAAYKALKSQLGFNLLGNFVELGGLAFVPDTPAVAALAEALAARHASWAGYYRGAYGDVGTARAAAAGGDEVVGPWAVIVFDALTPERLSYTIRMRFTLVPGTDDVASRFYRGLGTGYLKYYTSGWLTLQRAIDEIALDGALGPLNSTTAAVDAARMLWGTPMPVFSFERNSFYDSSGPLLGLVLCLSMIYPLGILIKSLVEEKETGIRELMHISGLINWALGAAWAVTYIALFIAVATVATIVLAGSVFPHCSAIVIWGLLFLFMSSCIPLGFLVSTAFNRARLAAIFGPFILFALVLPRYIFFRTSQGQALGGKRAACLLAPTAFTFAADALGRYEAGNAGVTLDNMWEGALSVGECGLWMFFDILLYSLLAWCFDYGIPNAARAGLPRWLPLPRALRHWLQPADGGAAFVPASDVEAGAAAADDIEGAQPGGTPVVVMRRLCKVYGNGVRAVAGLDLTLYDSEITALLGHNGAGKSTAIAMLTGALPPTSGGITVCGVDARERGGVRGVLGVCPQANVLFPLLSVSEHLRLFAVLKGVPSRDVASAVAALLREVGLEDKAHAAAAALSGGMKRRLQLACALAGGSRVLLADEPTSGVDPVSRRGIWELLRRLRASGICVLLTTHYLDEADLLADRVAVLSDGRLRAAGSPLFLKRRLGGGFTLSVTSAAGAHASGADAAAAAAADTPLARLVAAHAPGAALLRAAGGERAWQLSPEQRGCLSGLLAALERDRAALGITGFSVSSATLEEVFLRLAGEAPATMDAAAFSAAAGGALPTPGASVEMAQLGGSDEHERSDDAAAAASSLPDRRRLADSVSWLPGVKPRGAALLAERVDSYAPHHADDAHRAAPDAPEQPPQPAGEHSSDASTPASADHRTFRRSFREMVRKRYLIARRDYKSVLSQVALPTIAVALVLLVLKLDLDPTGPSLELSARSLLPPGANASAFTPVLFPAGAAAAPGGAPGSWADGFATPPLLLVPIAGGDGSGSDAARNSTTLSYALLANRTGEAPFRYGAYVPDDVVLPRFSPGLCLTGRPPSRGADAARTLLSALLAGGGTPPSAALLNTTAAVGASALRAAQELGPRGVNVLHNTSSPHALPIFISELRAAALRRAGGPLLTAASHPLPLTPEEVTTLAAFLRLLASFFVLIPFSYLPATYAAFVVRERAVGAKLLQLASGCGAVAYWLAQFTWEMINHTAVVLLCMALFFAFQIDVLVGTADKAIGILLLLQLYGLAVTPLSFCYSFLFDSHAAAQVAIACANFITGFCLVISSFIMGVTKATVKLNARLVVLFRIFPAFCLGEGLIGLATSSFDFGSLSDAGADVNASVQANATTYTAAAGAAPRNGFGDLTLGASRNAFAWDVLGRSLLLLCAECCFYSALTLFIELRGRRVGAALSRAAAWPLDACLARCRRGRADDDADAIAAKAAALQVPDPEVSEERARLQAGMRDGRGDAAAGGDAVQIRGLRKVFPPRGAAPAKTAVADLWLGVKAGERFGLLGENGAGKTTALSMLCCDVSPSAGDAIVGGASILGAPAAVQRQIRYCPQRDPILDLLTVSEHLYLYARLKGLPERAVASSAESTWRRVGLGPFSDRLAGQLSGGNKRKLSLAIAIIGAPAVLLCDEPRYDTHACLHQRVATFRRL
jgi:ABC-type multidrug transport system ATPase subunit